MASTFSISSDNRIVKKWPQYVAILIFSLKIYVARQPRALFQHLNFQKWSEHNIFYIYISKYISRHNGLRFFDILTAKSTANPTYFLYFHFKICFSPQPRVLSQYLNFQKRSEPDTFWCFFYFKMGFTPQPRRIFDFSSGQLAPHPSFKRAYFSILRSPKIMKKKYIYIYIL